MLIVYPDWHISRILHVDLSDQEIIGLYGMGSKGICIMHICKKKSRPGLECYKILHYKYSNKWLTYKNVIMKFRKWSSKSGVIVVSVNNLKRWSNQPYWMDIIVILKIAPSLSIQQKQIFSPKLNNAVQKEILLCSLTWGIGHSQTFVYLQHLVKLPFYVSLLPAKTSWGLLTPLQQKPNPYASRQLCVGRKPS